MRGDVEQIVVPRMPMGRKGRLSRRRGATKLGPEQGLHLGFRSTSGHAPDTSRSRNIGSRACLLAPAVVAVLAPSAVRDSPSGASNRGDAGWCSPESPSSGGEGIDGARMPFAHSESPATEAP